MVAHVRKSTRLVILRRLPSSGEILIQNIILPVKMPIPMFGIISSRLVPFVSGTKASENRKPKDEMMAYVQNVPWRPRLSWRSTNVLTPTNAQT